MNGNEHEYEHEVKEELSLMWQLYMYNLNNMSGKGVKNALEAA